MTSVMLVEDDATFLHRFCGIVVTDPAFQLFAAVGNLAAARQALLCKAPDVLITDLGLPDGSGIDLIRETAKRYPATDIMVITVFGDEKHVLASIEAGATGYLLKSSLPDEFLSQIKELVAGGSPISPLIARQLLRRFPIDSVTKQRQNASAAADTGLSPRENEVLSLITQGFQLRRDRTAPDGVAAHHQRAREKDLPKAGRALAGRGGFRSQQDGPYLTVPGLTERVMDLPLPVGAVTRSRDGASGQSGG